MAPTLDFAKRDYYCDSWGNNCYYRSRWHEWGRWVVLGLAIALFFLVLAYCLFTSRRRRRQGIAPMYGTGWISNGQKWGGQPQQNAYPMHDYNQQGYNPNYPPPNGEYQNVYPPAPPPPAYGQHQQPQHTGTTFNTNDGYYATGAAGVQPPHNTHQRDIDGYAPPQGPPPGKN